MELVLILGLQIIVCDRWAEENSSLALSKTKVLV